MAKNKRISREDKEEIDLYYMNKEIERKKILKIKDIQFKPGIKAKNPAQEKLLNRIKNNDITFVSGAAGVGKAQPFDAKILTPKGWVLMGDIKQGDKVFSSDGKPTTVLGVYPQGEKKIYKVTFNDGSFTECCKEHLWDTQTYKERNFRKRNPDRSQYRCEKPATTRTLEEISKTLYTKRGDKNHTIPITEPIEFTSKNLKIHPYILGSLIGDGCLLYSSILLTTADEEVIDNCNKFIHKDMEIKKKNYDKYSYSFLINKNSSVKNNYYNKVLKEYNLKGSGCYNKFIPKEYLFSSVEDRLELLRGLMDSDGYVDISGRRVQFTSTSKQLSDDVKFLIQSLGGTCTQIEKHKLFTYNGVKKNGRTSYDLTIKMNPKFNPFKISRKADKWIPKTRYKPKRYIISVDYVGVKEAQCIKVEHDSSHYITDDCIVTHNTIIALKAAIDEMKKDENKLNIVLTKPIIEAEESLGFLPGDISEKISPYMSSYYSNFEKLIGKKNLESLRKDGIIKEEPLAFMRGSTYDNSIMIMDEAQNTSIGALKLFISRLGENSKMIIMGDVDQTDLKLKRGDVSGLEDAFERFKGIEGVTTHKFEESDIVRNDILIKIMKRYSNR